MTLAAKASQPFFLNVGFHKPHTPYRAPQSFFDKYPDASQLAVAKEQVFPRDQNLTGQRLSTLFLV